ncbi:MAG: radical SAM family heme chaperone HemW [Sphingobacteriales bacterium]|nr:MAG: radical SAM family heme chaperone HemW [Sphingobacteriales bacterium]
MAGIYIHIPFCKQACNYCNFHFSTQTDYIEKMVQAIIIEIELQNNFFQKETTIQSIYFGGGTPSFIDINHILKILEKIYNTFTVTPKAEITIECNPDDLTEEYLTQLKQYTPINRLSIGIQSFFDEDLKFMHRAHNASEGKTAIQLAQKIGFNNITCDLIYGTPTLSNEQWKENILYLINHNIQHFSCYAITVEEKTILHHQIQKNIISEIDEQKIAEQFSILQDVCATHGYEQYEISNFCTNKQYAIHNTNYWKGSKYLGLGPSAHSFDGKNRYWNINNNALYIKQINHHQLAQSCETLSNIDMYNEYIMTKLRTIWGVDTNHIDKQFGNEFKKHFEFEIKSFIDNSWVVQNQNIYTLTNNGRLFCDYITENLFWVESE